MAQALWTTLRELRLAGFAPDVSQNVRGAANTPAGGATFCIRAFLDEQRATIWPHVYEEALKHLTGVRFRLTTCWTELPDTVWNPLQRR